MSRHAVAAGDAAVPAFDYSAAFPFRSPTYRGERTHLCRLAASEERPVVLTCPVTFTEIYDARSVMRDQQ